MIIWKHPLAISPLQIGRPKHTSVCIFVYESAYMSWLIKEEKRDKYQVLKIQPKMFSDLWENIPSMTKC